MSERNQRQLARAWDPTKETQLEWIDRLMDESLEELQNPNWPKTCDVCNDPELLDLARRVVEAYPNISIGTYKSNETKNDEKV